MEKRCYFKVIDGTFLSLAFCSDMKASISSRTICGLFFKVYGVWILDENEGFLKAVTSTLNKFLDSEKKSRDWGQMILLYHSGPYPIFFILCLKKKFRGIKAAFWQWFEYYEYPEDDI